ncbi:hypothetical protein AMECASPLE_024977, partial [Ameca splendens]
MDDEVGPVQRRLETPPFILISMVLLLLLWDSEFSNQSSWAPPAEEEEEVCGSMCSRVSMKTPRHCLWSSVPTR